MAGLANANNNHDNTVDIINNNTQWSQQLAAQQNLANQTTLITQGFCGVNNNIEKAILAGQQNTAAIIAASAANVQKVLDKMCEQETDRLRTALAEAKVIANNAAQTNELLSKLQPTAVPSYIVSSPYTSIYPPTTTTASAGA
jgi:23S rRNA C2498 (ribose-2'-O)-methylase RlmM